MVLDERQIRICASPHPLPGYAVGIFLRPAAVMKSRGKAASDQTYQNGRGLFSLRRAWEREPMHLPLALNHQSWYT